MWQEIQTISGTPDFTPFGEFMISPIRYIYIIYLAVLGLLGLRITDSGLLAWISLLGLILLGTKVPGGPILGHTLDAMSICPSEAQYYMYTMWSTSQGLVTATYVYCIVPYKNSLCIDHNVMTRCYFYGLSLYQG